MWLGIGLMTLAFFSLLAVLSFEKVSFVVPVTALSYVAGALGGRFFLGGRISLDRWAGICLVCIGVHLGFLGKGLGRMAPVAIRPIPQRLASMPKTVAFREFLAQAFMAFRADKVRATMTALGMVIGTSSLILVVTIALTGKEYVLTQIENIGTNLVWAEY